MMHRILRIAGALIAGYAVMAVIVIAGVTAAASLLVPAGGTPGAEYLTANFAISFLAALAGGWVAQWAGGEDRQVAILLLAGLVLVVGLAMEGGGGQPDWYSLAIPLIGAVGVIAGGIAHGLLRRRTAV